MAPSDAAAAIAPNPTRATAPAMAAATIVRACGDIRARNSAMSPEPRNTPQARPVAATNRPTPKARVGLVRKSGVFDTELAPDRMSA
ncbi:unannotated protein [freshwater metagenome]|uniref:Unannotated protein n=1 Tax=freshwater metagenome TaxID=449393 RepID=A0A6J7JR24_9ZZZZ